MHLRLQCYRHLSHTDARKNRDSNPPILQPTQQNVRVNALETQTPNPKLSVGSSSQTVTVSTAPPALETTNATLGGTMESEMYSALPLQMGAGGQPDQRRATDFAALMPGVQANETNGNLTTNTGVVNGSGSRGAAVKPIEHQNEYGIYLSGPLWPKLKNRLFFHGNYDGCRYSRVLPTFRTFPTLAEQQGTSARSPLAGK